MELLRWKFKREILQCRLPVGPTKPDISFFSFHALYFFSGKNQNLLDMLEHCIRKLGEIRSELELLFGIYY